MNGHLEAKIQSIQVIFCYPLLWEAGDTEVHDGGDDQHALRGEPVLFALVCHEAAEAQSQFGHRAAKGCTDEKVALHQVFSQRRSLHRFFALFSGGTRAERRLGGVRAVGCYKFLNIARAGHSRDTLVLHGLLASGLLHFIVNDGQFSQGLAHFAHQRLHIFNLQQVKI